MNATKPTPSWRDVLPIQPTCELFPPMAPDELRALGEDIAKNGLTSPIALWCADKRAPVVLLDGGNRLDAIEANTGCQVQVVLEAIRQRNSTTLWSIKAGEWISDDKVVVPDGSVDPYAYVISANFRRRHLSIEDKDKLIIQLLKADPTKSNRTVAKLTDRSHPHVAKVRAELETGDVETVTTAVDTKGRKQPARKAPTKPRLTSAPKNSTARDDCGATSSSEIERLRARNDELERENRRLERENIALRSELDDARAARKGLVAAERPAETAADDGLGIPAWLRRAAP